MAEFVKSFNDIVGHKHILSYLDNKIKTDSIPNILLFVGNPGLGKTSIAKLLSIAVNGGKESLIKPVIEENKSVDCIKLYNMSSIGDDTDSIVAELQNASFSSTGRKVIILDEVHGMTKSAQDAILVNLEYLPKGIYVFMCTTEIGVLRQSLVSRCVTIHLNNLSFNEIKKLIKRKIILRGLTFDVNLDLIVNVIANWAGNEPRRAINLIESFTQNIHVTQDELSAFVTLNNVPVVIQTIQYLYGSLTLGIDFVSSFSITPDLLSTFIEVLKVGLGHNSSICSREDTEVINRLFVVNNIDNFLRFVVDINSTERISKRVFTAKFIKYHSTIYGNEDNIKPVQTTQAVLSADIQTIEENAVERLRIGADNLQQTQQLRQEIDLEALFAAAPAVE